MSSQEPLDKNALLPDAVVEEIVAKVMAVAATFKPRLWVHLFGVFRPKLQAKFRELKVDSFDSASYFRFEWLCTTPSKEQPHEET